MAIVGIIPARYGSKRLPGKPLSEIHGKTLIERVYARACAARSLDRVLVATDDERIATVVRSFGGVALLTSPRHRSGTDRLAEAVGEIADAEIVVNVQGDEPLLDPGAVDAAVAALVEDPALPIATLSVPLRSEQDMLSPSVVKVVADEAGNALYFSRAPIPHTRVADGDARAAVRESITRGLARQHVGLYAYRREALVRFASLPPSPLEEAEELEQLRALHHGLRIRVVALAGESGIAVDTPEDLERVRALLSPGKGTLA